MNDRPATSRPSRKIRLGLLGLLAVAVLGVAAIAWTRREGTAPAPPREDVAAPASSRAAWIWHYRTSGPFTVLPIYQRLAEVAPADVDIAVVVSDPSSLETARRALGDRTPAGGDIRYVRTKLPLPISPWARDPYTFLERGGRPIVLDMPPGLTKADGPGDHQVAPALRAAIPDLQVRIARLAIEGGDVIVAGDRVFLGVTTLHKNRTFAAFSEERIVREVKQLFGRKVVVVGSDAARVPHEHIDMFMTPLGDRTVALGDPLLALDALFGADSSRRSVKLGELGEFRLEDQEAVIAEYRAIAAKLEQDGFRVLRLPIAHGVAPEPGKQGVTLSWNNVLLHTDAQGKRHVYLPTYGVGTLDALARSRWAEWGYVVHAVPVREAAVLGGALRCLTNVLNRRPSS